MSRNDPDLQAVRDLAPGHADPTDESVARTWSTLVARQLARPFPRRRLPRLVAPVATAGVVMALAVGAAVVFGPDASPIRLPWAAPGDTGSAEPNRSPATADAITALNQLAAAAEQSEAVTLEPGQLIYVEYEGWAAGFTMGADGQGGGGVIEPEPRQIWLDPEGMIPLRIMAGDEDLTAGPGSNHDDQVAQARQHLERAGPSLYQATPGWLAGLPTQPAALLEILRGLMEPEDAWSTDHQVWSAMSDLYASCELLLSPSLQAGLLRAFTQLHGLSAARVNVDGRELVSIRHTERGTADAILFDPATGRAVGRQSLFLDDDTVLVQPTDGPALDPGVSYQATWTQALVHEVGETGSAG